MISEEGLNDTVGHLRAAPGDGNVGAERPGFWLKSFHSETLSDFSVQFEQAGVFLNSGPENGGSVLSLKGSNAPDRQGKGLHPEHSKGGCHSLWGDVAEKMQSQMQLLGRTQPHSRSFWRLTLFQPGDNVSGKINGDKQSCHRARNLKVD